MTPSASVGLGSTSQGALGLGLVLVRGLGLPVALGVSLIQVASTAVLTGRAWAQRADSAFAASSGSSLPRPEQGWG